MIIQYSHGEQCGQEDLAKCAKRLQVLSSTSDLSIATRKEELDALCPDLHAGLHCIRSYTRRCMSLKQRNHFNKLYSGTNQVIRDLCKVGTYQDEFLRHAPCLKSVRNDYEVCAKRYQAIMSSINQELGSQNLNNNNQTTTTATEMNEEGNNSSGGSGGGDDNLIGTVCCSFTEYLDCSERTALKHCGQETAAFTRGYLDKMSNSIIKVCL